MCFLRPFRVPAVLSLIVGLSSPLVSTPQASAQDPSPPIQYWYDPEDGPPPPGGNPCSCCGQQCCACCGPHVCCGQPWEPPTKPVAGAGAPRPWQEGIKVSTYGTVNLANGNLSLEVPLVSMGVDGRGPDIVFTLYYNSLSAGGTAPEDCWPQEIGRDWRHTFMTHVYLDATGTVAELAEADGTLKRFDLIANTWVAEPGVFDTLLSVAGGGWNVIRKNQWVWEFDADGYMIAVSDSAGSLDGDANRNVLTITRDTETHRVSHVTDAAGRTLTFVRDIQEKKIAWVEMNTGADPTRYWYFWYFVDASVKGRLASVSDPRFATTPVSDPTDPEYYKHRLYFAYDTSTGLIEWEVNKAREDDPFSGSANSEHAFHFLYAANGTVSSVTDPEPLFHLQSFIYSTDGLGYVQTYTDRRGKPWHYVFNAAAELTSRDNPIPSEPPETFLYDPDHNRTQYTNGLGQTWTYAYDDRGNLLSTADPLAHATLMGYDQYNNLRTFCDQAGNVTAYDYDAANDPARDLTLVTKVIEPPDGQGNPAADTLYAYFGPADPPAGSDPDAAPGDWNGLLASVTDANAVLTAFEYDRWGQPRKETEGGTGSLRSENSQVESGVTHDFAGRATATESGHGGGSASHDPGGNPTTVTCIVGPTGACGGCRAAGDLELGDIFPLPADLTAPPVGEMASGCGSFIYDGMDRVTNADRCVTLNWTDDNKPDEE